MIIKLSTDVPNLVNFEPVLIVNSVIDINHKHKFGNFIIDSFLLLYFTYCTLIYFICNIHASFAQQSFGEKLFIFIYIYMFCRVYPIYKNKRVLIKYGIIIK